MNTVDFKRNLSADANRQPSPAIWADCPVKDLIENPGLGTYFFDDFQDFPLDGTQTTQIGHGKYKVFNTGGGKVSRISAVNSVELAGGALRIQVDTDNDSGSIAQSFPSYFMSGVKSTGPKIWFECCVAQSAIPTNNIGWMVGLAEVELWTLATGVPFNGGDAITNGAAFIGFRAEEDGLGVVDTVYSDRATSFTNIGDTEAGTMVANTFRKFGFVYDPDKTTNCVTFFANNLELTTKYSKTDLVALTNLDANMLGIIAAVVSDSAGTTTDWWMKWWRVAQLLP